MYLSLWLHIAIIMCIVIYKLTAVATIYNTEWEKMCSYYARAAIIQGWLVKLYREPEQQHLYNTRTWMIVNFDIWTFSNFQFWMFECLTLTLHIHLIRKYFLGIFCTVKCFMIKHRIIINEVDRAIFKVSFSTVCGINFDIII